MSDALPAAERLLNLVIALVNTTGKMTKEQIRDSVAGYDRTSSTDAFERMFERDKETLRVLGVPVITVTGAAHGDEQGYRVDGDAYALPPMELSAAQLGVLALAAEFWSDQSLRVEASRALTKLRVVGERPAGLEAVLGLAPRVHPAGPALGPPAGRRRGAPGCAVHLSCCEHRRGQGPHRRAVASAGQPRRVVPGRPGPRPRRTPGVPAQPDRGTGGHARGGRRLRRAARRGPARDAGLRAGGRGAHRLAGRAARAGRGAPGPGAIRTSRHRAHRRAGTS